MELVVRPHSSFQESCSSMHVGATIVTCRRTKRKTCAPNNRFGGHLLLFFSFYKQRECYMRVYWGGDTLPVGSACSLCCLLISSRRPTLHGGRSGVSRQARKMTQNITTTERVMALAQAKILHDKTAHHHP